MDTSDLVQANVDEFGVDFEYIPPRGDDTDAVDCTGPWRGRESEVRDEENGREVVRRAECGVLRSDVDNPRIEGTIVRNGDRWAIYDREVQNEMTRLSLRIVEQLDRRRSTR